MSNVNLGHATAYGYAKSKGYTGTEQEFAEVMATLTDAIGAAEDAADDAADSAEDASDSATEAANSATTATQKADHVEQVLSRAISIGAKRYSQKFTFDSSTTVSTKTFNPTGYTYNSTDVFSVYLDGAKLTDDSYSVSSSAVVTFSPALSVTSSNVLEIVADTDVELETDTTLTLAGAAADSKTTGDEINNLKDDLIDVQEEIDSFEGISVDVKEALLACFRGVVYATSDSQTLYNNLHDALYASDTVVSISAVYSQGSAVIYPDESLENLRGSLVVTATYADSHTGTVNGYTLSGTLVGGTTSTITVTYRGKTTIFSVVVTDYEWGSDYTWLYRADQDGLLSQNENVSDVVAVGGQTPATETLGGNVLNLSAEYDGVNHGSIFKLIPLTSTSASLKAKVKFNALPIASPGAGLRMQVSNGTSGAQLFISRYSNEPNQPKISTFEGSTSRKLGDIILGQWYIITCELSGNTQIIKVDNVTYNPSALSSYANTEIRIIALEPDNTVSSAPGDLNFDIAWVAFKDSSN